MTEKEKEDWQNLQGEISNLKEEFSYILARLEIDGTNRDILEFYFKES